MISRVNRNESLHAALNEFGAGATIREGGSALIKVNLARPPEPGHPRTDASLLTQVIQYVARHGALCAIAEGADGFLQQNIESIGLSRLIEENKVRVLDLDLEDSDCVTVDDEKHYLPRCFKDYAVRIGVPAISKHPGMIFSNNVKLFVGAVPRKMYQTGELGAPRPRVHRDLHTSVANIYRAVMAYAPFDLFVNGGKALIEGQGEIDLGEILVGDNALELDQYVLKKLGIEPPEYIRRLTGRYPIHRH